MKAKFKITDLRLFGNRIAVRSSKPPDHTETGLALPDGVKLDKEVLTGKVLAVGDGDYIPAINEYDTKALPAVGSRAACARRRRAASVGGGPPLSAEAAALAVAGGRAAGVRRACLRLSRSEYAAGRVGGVG